jgi:hypothetical protein
MHLSTVVLCLLSCAPGTSAQSFYTAISQYPQLSNFTLFYQNNFPLASLLLTPSSTEPHTVLIPNNDAFTNYEHKHGYSVTYLSATELESLIRYHVLIGSLTSTNFSAPRGLTAPSLLVDQQYNNRSAGVGLSSSFGNATGVNGQVVFISGPHPHSNKFLVRKSGTQSLKVHTGLSSDANLTALDGIWDGGRFQEIDQYVSIFLCVSDTLPPLQLADSKANVKPDSLPYPSIVLQLSATLVSAPWTLQSTALRSGATLTTAQISPA